MADIYPQDRPAGPLPRRDLYRHARGRYAACARFPRDGIDAGTRRRATRSARYTSAVWKTLEDEKMWPNVWQFAAREEDMPIPATLWFTSWVTSHSC